eukprot:5316736-Pleurochrysis_carterae.AAC.1
MEAKARKGIWSKGYGAVTVRARRRGGAEAQEDRQAERARRKTGPKGKREVHEGLCVSGGDGS